MFQKNTDIHYSTLMIPSVFKYTLTIIMLHNLKVFGRSCVYIQKLDDRYTVNCSNLNLEQVPDDLHESIRVLDLSYNHILKLDDKSFRKYNLLEKLIFSHNGYHTKDSNLTKLVSYTQDCFAVIPELFELDISYTYFGPIISVNWPSSLEILTINNCQCNQISLSSLINLRELYAFGNNLSSFPQLNTLSPLTVLDIRDNKIEIFDPENISPFCLLNYFNFDITVSFQSKKYFCSCERLKRWIEETVIFGSPRMWCHSASVQSCEPIITSYMLIQYEQCLGRHPQAFLKAVVVTFTIFVILVFSILVVIFLTKSTGSHKGVIEEEEEGDEDDYWL